MELNMHDFIHDCQCHHTEGTGMPHMPLIGDTAPAFTAQTTNGTVNFPTDYAGKWVILFSHPADFTPVCTTEFMVFQSMIEEFRKLNTEIIGLSVGTLTGHLAWIEAIRHLSFGDLHDINITFPIIDDMTMEIANKYGMIHPHATDTKTVRAVFIIDPNAKIRTILYYPPSVGRNFAEILRALVALQTTDKYHVSTPANWVPGDDVVVSSPSTTTEMDARMRRADKNQDVQAWFLTFKKLPRK